MPIISGKATFNIPPGTQSGTIFSLRGRGVPHLRGHGAGDQLVKVIVQIPTKLTDKEDSLIRELAEARGEKVAPRDKSLFEKVKDAFTRGA